MSHVISRATVTIAFSTLAVLTAFVIPSSAATGPWNWKDVSDQIPLRSNRPIWAIAYASRAWFYTDGQDLAKTGHVWRTDGKTSREITAEIRSAGLSRVDDIVSDGITVLFLKNHARQNRSLEVLALNNMGYSHRTAEFRAILSPTEGIRALAGNAGTWDIVTTSGRVVRADGTPSPLLHMIDSTDRISSVTINGTHTCLVTVSPISGNRARISDSVTTQTVALPADLLSLDGKKTTCAWTGTSWMLMNGKQLFRLFEGRLETYGRTRDSFLTLASDGDGTVLLGGAVSLAMFHGPSHPLTAKLARVYEAKSAAFPSPRATSNTSQWTWIEPNLPALRRDQTTSYNVGAWNANGIKKTEVFVNWALRRTCEFGETAMGNQTCMVPLNGSSYDARTAVTMIAKITDARDAVTWTPLTTLEVADAAYAHTIPTSVESTHSALHAGVSAWTWLEPNLSSMQRDGRVVLKAQARATDGLNRIELIANNAVRKLCDFARSMGTQNCELTLAGAEGEQDATVVVYAKAISTSGVIAVSPKRTINIRDNVKDAGAHPARVSTWISPTKDILRDGEAYTFFVQAQDIDGLDRIDILIDNAVQRTCAHKTAFTIQECSMALDARQYPSTPSITIFARATDAHGFVTWADARAYTLWHGPSSL